jgi:ElaB/YqjD/DUF883 family membrane-anchored ribosome-binding protein
MPEQASSTPTPVHTATTEAGYRDEINRLKADIGTLQADVSEIIGLLKHSATNKGSDIKDKVGKEAEHLFDQLMDKLDEGVSRGRKTVDEVGEQIGEHPVGTLFITFSLGYILAKIMERGGGSGKSN